jgi:hypothetical protein
MIVFFLIYLFFKKFNSEKWEYCDIICLFTFKISYFGEISHPKKTKGCSEVLLFPPKLQQSLGTWRKCFLWFPREHEACRLCCHIPLFTRDLLTFCVCVCVWVCVCVFFLGANLYIILFYFLAKWWRFITYKWTMIWLGN